MPHTLKEIVNSALAQADASIKVASLRDAPIEDRSLAHVDQYLAHELGQVEVEPVGDTTKVASGVTAASDAARASQYDDVRFALKLAEALEHGARVVEKLALSGPLNKSTGGAPHAGATPPAGPAHVHKQPFENAKVVTPRSQASARARHDAHPGPALVDGHPPTDEGRMLNEGPVIPRNYPNGKNITNHVNSKHASRQDVERLLRSKIAQHRMLVALGQTDAANAVLKEAAELSNVGSAASLERVGANHDHSNLVFKDDYGAAKFPSNEQIRNLTKAQARDANQREAGSFFGEGVKRDNAVAAHTLSTHGLKLSSRQKKAQLGALLVHGAVSKKDEPASLIAGGVGGFKFASKSVDSGTSSAAAGGIVPGIGNVIGALDAGPSHNRGARAAAAGVGGAIGGEGGRRAGKAVMNYAGRNGPHGVPAKVLGQAIGAVLGASAGGGGGNAAAHHFTKKASLKLAKKGKKEHESSGQLGTAAGNFLLGPGPGAALGAGFSGPKHDRGRRALGAGAGSLAGAIGGYKLMGMPGFVVGSYGGGALGNHLGRKEAALKFAKRKRKSEGGGGGAALGATLAGPLGAALGAGVSGSEHDRGRRAFGAGAGSLGGAVLGGLAGAATKNPALVRAGAGVGSIGGGVLGNHLGRKEASIGSTIVGGIGKGLGAVGGGLSRAGQWGLKHTANALENVKGQTAAGLYSGAVRGRHALANMSSGAQKALGGAALGAGALGMGTGFVGGRATAR